MHHIYDAQGIKQSIDQLLTGEDGTTRWQPAMSNEWGHLATGNKAGVQYTDTIKFIPYSDVAGDVKVLAISDFWINIQLHHTMVPYLWSARLLGMW